MTVIFVGGVHGVGKTTCCSKLSKLLDCIYISASEIIRSQKADAISKDSKLVKNVADNQTLLLRGFEEIKKHAAGKLILLDGHFALIDESLKIQKISSDIFNDLAIDKLVCLIDDPKEISQRLFERDGKSINPEQIESLQEAETSNAREISQATSIPLTILHGSDIAGLTNVAIDGAAKLKSK